MTLTATEQMPDLDHVEFVPCRSKQHQDMPKHPADWHMICPCGGTRPVCNERKLAREYQGGMWCNRRDCKCDEYHPIATLQFIRI